ncbi:DUF1350 family protein [Candidatus Chloroploca asiatica]|uniref:Thioesterase n=1 Tax=Candidatus Chloroploca asiatica TaxID=1506545 RepID=A0A2H3L2P8_9CHLR|nr:DUF1350 family protein [Candidatus Chloroploca asiatica]PDV97417.1 hypothetical protein A9Q02_18365 [Candidatus Chloroploca asiatica]
MRYQRVSRSFVALHPRPIGVITFYGGQFFGQLPTTAYAHFLESLFEAGYSLMVVPFQFGFRHDLIAEQLLVERDTLRERLPLLAELPQAWVGHSVGCKYLALLEAFTDSATGKFVLPGMSLASATRTGILDEPSLLLAPDMSDTRDAVPFLPVVPRLLDQLGLGVRPSRAETQRLIEQDDLFGLTALISFDQDTIAGRAHESPEVSDVAWFLQTLEARTSYPVLHRELAGDHLEPVGIRYGDMVYSLRSASLLGSKSVPRAIEQTALEFLAELGRRRDRAPRRR